MMILWTGKKKLAEMLTETINAVVKKEVDERFGIENDYSRQIESRACFLLGKMEKEEFIDEIIARIKRKQLK